LLLKVKGNDMDSSMIMTFHEESERSFFYTTLTGVNIQTNETVYADIPLKGLYIEQLSQAESFSQSARDVLGKMEWQRLRVINKDPDDPDHEHAKTILSEHLRLCADSSSGRVTDRVNLGKRRSFPSCGGHAYAIITEPSVTPRSWPTSIGSER
jgi:hypothetical protein